MKKIPSIMLSAAMLISTITVPVSADVAATSNPALDISGITGGVSFFSQDFEGKTVGDTISTSDGFGSVSQWDGTNGLGNARYVVAQNVNGNTGNVLWTKPHLMYMHAKTYAEKFNDVIQEVTLNNKKYKVLDYDFDGDGTTTDETYCLAYNSGVTDLYWFKKSSINSNTISGNNRTDYGNWFYVDATDSTKITGAYEGQKASGSIITFKTPSSSELIGTIAYQFDFTYPQRDGYAYGGEEGIALRFDEKEIYIRDKGIKSSSDVKFLTTGTTTKSIKKGAENTVCIPKVANAPTYVATADKNTYLAEQSNLAVGGEWHKIMLKIDCIENTYTIYYDGQPLYVPIDGGYSCAMKMDKTAYKLEMITNRMCTYADREPYFDNFKGVYATHKVEGVGITDLVSGGTSYFTQNFDAAGVTEGTRITKDFGFKEVNDTQNKANVRYIVGHDDITNVSETSNRVMALQKNCMLMRPTAEQWTAMSGSTTTVKLNNTTYKVIDMNNDYYMGATSRNSMMYWFKKSSVQNGTVSGSDNTDYGKWFDLSENNVIKPSNDAGNPSLTFENPSSSAGMYAISFDFAYPDNGNLDPIGEEGFNLNIDGYEYHIRRKGVTRSGNNGVNLCFDDGQSGETLKVESNNKAHTMVPKISVSGTPYSVSSADKSTYLNSMTRFYNNKEWHNVMVYVNKDKKYYSIYFDGIPVYIEAKDNGGYSCRMKFKGGTLGDIRLETMRYCIYNDHMPVFDNFVGYETSGTPQEVADRYAASIKMPYISNTDIITTDILFDKNERELITSCAFGNGYFTMDTANNLIARNNAPYGWGTVSEKLTVTCGYQNATATKTFNLTVKQKAPYEIDTVVIKDSVGNRIYRPKNGSKIESVSYTKVKSDAAAADLYLAVYDKDGRLINSQQGTPSETSGKFTFNQEINATDTYKVFVWDNGLQPLAEMKTADYPVSEAPKAFVIGDSIAQTYNNPTGLVGFGERLVNAFNCVTVDNSQAVGGRTTKYALAENRLKYVIGNGKTGDYLFIMLGHNDEKVATDYYATTTDEYKMLLTQMVDTAKAHGITPVLLTPLVRNQWLDIDSNGDSHKVKDSHKDYSAAMREVAEKTGTAIIDVDAISKADIERLGKLEVERLKYFNGTDTHTLSAGADWVVEIIRDELAKMNLPISGFVKTN